jgi:UDP-glucuronate decarboxylase
LSTLSSRRPAEGVADDGAAVVSRDLDYIHESLRPELAELADQDVLITGGAGFLGYYLVQTLTRWNSSVAARQRARITVYDNYVRGVPGWLRRLADAAEVGLVGHDVSQPLPPDIGNVAYVLHAASIASPSYYRRYPLETMDANVNGVRHLLELARARRSSGTPVRGVLFFSTSEIYGDPTPENIPTSESYRGNVSCTGPRACYDEAKRYGETLCVTFARQYGVPVKIVRPFNNYGPGLRLTDGRVVADFARDILAGRDVILLSDGSPTRTFCYVADAVVGYYKVLLRGQSGQAYNIGVEAPEISVAELAGRMVSIAESLFAYRGRVVTRVSGDADYLVDNPQRRCPLIARARADVGYDPRISLEDGLRRSLVWYRANTNGEI